MGGLEEGKGLLIAQSSVRIVIVVKYILLSVRVAEVHPSIQDVLIPNNVYTS